MMKSCGTLVLVVGPSGAGKDSIIRGAQANFAHHPRFVFPRRIVTRKADVMAEDHDSISDIAFASNAANGDYAVWWEAHGNSYGIPITIDDDLSMGRTVIFNCSRTVVGEVQKRFPKVVVADIQVSVNQLVDRIVARGRESREEAIERANRVVPPFPPGTTMVPIQNDSNLDVAISTFCNLLRMLDDAGTDPGGSSFDDQNKYENGDDGCRRLVVVK